SKGSLHITRTGHCLQNSIEEQQPGRSIGVGQRRLSCANLTFSTSRGREKRQAWVEVMAMRPKHKQFATQYASIFGDASVVQAYQYRPPYPPETFEILLSLIDADAAPRTVLDAGCGPGNIARALVQEVDRVDAVDVAARMIAAGKALSQGDDPKL